MAALEGRGGDHDAAIQRAFGGQGAGAGAGGVVR